MVWKVRGTKVMVFNFSDINFTVIYKFSSRSFVKIAVYEFFLQFI